MQELMVQVLITVMAAAIISVGLVVVEEVILAVTAAAQVGMVRLEAPPVGMAPAQVV